jgi:hypothetical protein
VFRVSGAPHNRSKSDACAWVSAFWSSDYEDAKKGCASGDQKKCRTAIQYSGGCEFRGYEGAQPYPGFISEGGGPFCNRLNAFPASLVKA